ncbi:golgi-body localization protein domain-containing protein [Gongronella butleri]|nr:golgi-body localization protein domain-containing protein [Gongronella butleri]
MTLSVYDYIVVVVVLLVGRMLLHWVIGLCFQLRFGRFGFFSISDIQYRQRTKAGADALVVSIGTIKVRVKRPASSLSSAWITVHLDHVTVDVPSMAAWRAKQQAQQEQKQQALTRRVSSRLHDALPQLPWWYSLSIVKHVIKLSSALPAQLLMAGLANYVDLQATSLRFAIEGTAMFQMHDASLSSILFAAVHAPDTPIAVDEPLLSPFSLNANHERHSLKRAQHLFKEKFFEIIVAMGPITIGPHALRFPQGGRIAISCHLSAGCVTLKDVDVSVQIDDIDLHIDKIKALVASLPTFKKPPAPSPTPRLKATSTKRSQQLVRLIRSLGITTSRIHVYQDIRNVTFGLAVDLLHANVTLDHGVDPSCNLKVGLEHPKVFWVDGAVQWQLLSMTHVEAHASLFGVPLVPLVKRVQDDAPNEHAVLVDVSMHKPLVDTDTDQLQRLMAKLAPKAPKAPKQTNEVERGALDADGGPKVMYKQLPKMDLHVKLVEPVVRVCVPSGHACVIQFGAIALNALGEYTHDDPHGAAAAAAAAAAATATAPENGGLRKRKPMHWTRFFRNTWRFRRATVQKPSNHGGDDDDVDGQWMYAASTRLSIDQWRVFSSMDKHDDENNALLDMASFQCLVATRFSTFTASTGHLLVQCQLEYNPCHDVEVQLDQLALYPCATIKKDAEDMVVPWLALERAARRVKSTHRAPETRVYTAPAVVPIDQWFDRVLNGCRINVVLSHLSVIVDGCDQGVKGQRPVPEGFIDNAPDQDILTHVTAQMARLALTFHGPDHTTKPPLAGSSSSQLMASSTSPWVQGQMDRIKILRRFDTHEKTGDTHLILWVPHANTNLFLEINADDHCCIASPSLIIKQVGVHATIANHYALLLVHERILALKSKIAAMQKEEKENGMPPPPKASIREEPPKQPIFVLQKAQFQLNRLDLHLVLPEEVALFLRMDGLRLARVMDNALAVCMRNAGLFGQGAIKGTWDQLMDLDELQYAVQTGGVHTLDVAKFHVRMPYEYVAADIIDNVVNLIKYVKSIRPRLVGSNTQPFTFFGPSIKDDPVLLPRIRLRCDKVCLQLEDDPFESRLRLIWRTGLAEQRARLDVLDAFEAKAKTELPERVQHARERLDEHNSRSWIKHINEAIRQETMMFTHRHSQYYRATTDFFQREQAMKHDETTVENAKNENENDESVAKALFEMPVMDLPKHYALLDWTARDIDLQIRPPDFSLENTRAFMHDLGKGLPLDTQFSTLIPFHVDLKGGELSVQLRDYPIPLAHVPGAWHLTGDYVFGDEAGDQDGTRTVPIPVLVDRQLGFNYVLHAVRVSSPPKFYSVVHIRVDSPKLTSICWCVPYQPAIQDVTRTMDLLTRPPVDPSEKVGFWDKLRLMIHTRTKICYAGDLALVLKGTRDPYDMTDQGFGLAKIWKGNVVWWMGHANPQEEFTQITSQDLLFGVPDLIHGGFQTLLLDNASSSFSSSSSLEKDYQDDNDDAASRTTLELPHPFLKMALRFTGGIRMGLGCHLERICIGPCEKCDGKPNREKCRHLHFLPHYKVRYKCPRAVAQLPDHGKDYDAFAGFRSHFIHFSMSITKLSDDEYADVFEKERDTAQQWMNSLHLTPGFVEHFLSCFRLFGGNMSYPLRTGSYYPRVDTRLPKKFGFHMQSMKYKVVVDPLRIGYFYKNESLVMDDEHSMDGLGDVVGLKGQVKRFAVDVHQQREIKNNQRSWAMTEAEVQLVHLDLRAVRATYTDLGGTSTSSTSGAASTSAATTTTTATTVLDDYESCIHADPDLMQGTDRHADENQVDINWVDHEDFVELNVLTPDALPNVHILPFAYSPCMYYLKQNDPQDVQRYQYLRGTHDCIIGTAPDTRDMQISLLEERSKNIDVQIRKHQTRLHNVERKLHESPEDEAILLKESKAIVEKTEILFEKRNLLQQYLRELSTKNAQSNSTIFGQDTIKRWEEVMGHFKVRYILHNPQIIWNNSIRNIVYHFMDLQAHSRALKYYMSARSVKFIRDITKKYKQEQRPPKHHHHQYHTHQAHVVDDVSDNELDKEVIQDLLDHLLAERATKLYATNETENDPTLLTETIDLSNSDHVNNPEMQARSIPLGYSITSSYLIDLLNPQVSLQSDHDPNNLVLMHNERMQVKAMAITDDKEQDEEIQLVKNRTVVSLNNTQFFVAKKEQFDTVDLLLDNHYGAKGHEHWLAWVPAEMLIRYVKRSDKFQRVGTRVSPTILIDRYNDLRLKAHHHHHQQHSSSSSAVFAQCHPLEERCDAVYLNFLELALTADSAQYNAIYEVIVDLLLYKEPAKKERLERLRDITMAADQGSLLLDATENIVELQNRVRRCIALRDQYQHNLALLDEKNMADFKQVRVALQDAFEDLYLGMEGFKLLQQTHRRSAATTMMDDDDDDDAPHDTITWKFTFSAAKISWEMRLDSETPLCEWHLTNTTFSLVNKDDHSHINTAEVDMLYVKNTSTNPAFGDILSPFIDTTTQNKKKLPDFSRHKMLRCYLVALAPVGGIPVIQHLEINLFPIRVQMTYDFGRAMASYFFPAERRQQRDAEKQQQQQQSLLQDAPQVAITRTASHQQLHLQNDQPPPSPASFTATIDSSSDTNTPSGSLTVSADRLQKSASANLEFKDRRDSASNLSTSGGGGRSSYPRSATIDNLRSVGAGTAASDSLSSSYDALDVASTDTSSLSTSPSSKRKQKQLAKQQQQPPQSQTQVLQQGPDDLEVMKQRATGNRTFILVKIPGTKHCITYKGPKDKNIEDLTDFAFQQPYLEYRNKTWSWFELLSNIKRDFMRTALLHNSRALLKEKLTIRRQPRHDFSFDSFMYPDSSASSPLVLPIATPDSAQHRQSISDDDALDGSDSDSLQDLDSDKPASIAASSSSWTSKFKRKKPESSQPSLYSVDMFKNRDGLPRSPMEELTIKGQLLLGKHYHGPTLPRLTNVPSPPSKKHADNTNGFSL